MNGTRIKLCGMMRPEDIAAANPLKPDLIGFVFWKKARRYVTPEAAAEMKKLLLPEIKAAGVFVDEDPAVIADIARRVPLDLVQLHGTETEEMIRTVQEMTGLPVIRAFTVTGPEVLGEAEKSPADMILLDSGKGSGMPFRWELIAGFRRPFFLAGGMTAENVGKALKTLHPLGVDVSSALETEGKKDPEKMRAFTEAVKKASEG